MNMKKKIPLFSLIILIVASIDSIRTLPTTAFFGSPLIFFFLLSAIFFLIPVSLVSAEFSSRYPEEGGIFHWIRHAFGEKFGLLAVWLQWVNTMVWYPTMLLFIGGTIAYIIDPAIAEDKTTLLFINLINFWGLTLWNLKGIRTSALFNSICSIIGTLLPMLFLIFLASWWVIAGHPIAISFSLSALIPEANISIIGGALITIMASFVGMELAGVHVNDIHNPQKNFPKAIAFAVAILLYTLILGALSIAVIIPKDDIHFVDGVMQTFTNFLNAFNLSFLISPIAILIVVGSVGGSVNWLLAPAKGLVQAAEHGFLPDYFLKKNVHNVPVRILIFQAIFVSLLCFAQQLIDSVNAYYWFLVALSTSLYMLMYILLFLATLKLGRPKRHSNTYRIPLGIRRGSCFMGLISCTAIIILALQPIEGVIITSTFNYACFVLTSLILMIIPVFFLWRYKIKKTFWI